jgi:hypothetical protein
MYILHPSYVSAVLITIGISSRKCRQMVLLIRERAATGLPLQVGVLCPAGQLPKAYVMCLCN